MATISEALAAAREKREAEEARKAAEAAALEKEVEETEAIEATESGFFQSFFGRKETIDESVDAAERANRDRQKSNQSTDARN